MTKKRFSKFGLSRRGVLQASAGAAALPLFHIREVGAAGKVSIGFWDHWVPAGNVVMKKQVERFQKKTNIAVQADFITSVGNKNLLTIAAEAQAGAGHDIEAFPTWEVHNHSDKLEPVDDVVKQLEGQYGAVNPVCSYLAQVKGHWLAVPSSSGTQNKGPCGRISILKAHGFDPVAMYPAKSGIEMPGTKAWTMDEFLKQAELAAKAGKPFGIGLGQTTDSVDSTGSFFASFGAALIDPKGNINLQSEGVMAALEFGQKLVKFLPKDAVSYDDASNNRALISGQGALIYNPPSAWAVAKQTAPKIAADCWTFPPPVGPAGRFTSYLPYFWGIWQFSKAKPAAKELIAYLSQRDNVEERANAVAGYDIPPFQSMDNFKIWEEVEPPKGTVFNYPIRPDQHTTSHVACSYATPDIAVQIYNQGTESTMLAKLQSGQSIKQVLAWAKNELEGFMH